MSIRDLFKLNQKLWALSFAFFSLFLLGLADNIRGPLFPEILTEFHLSSGIGSWSFAMTSTAAFFGSYLCAFLLKKWKISNLLLFAVVSMGLGLLIMGTAIQLNVLLVGSFILGLSIGIMGVVQNILVAENANPASKAKVLSGLHAMYGFASFFAPIIASQMAIAFDTWRAAFYFVTGVCFLFVIVQVLIQPQPAFLIQTTSETDINSKPKLRLKSLVMMGGLLGLYVVAEILVATRLAQYMRSYYNMDLKASSQYVTYFFLFLLLGRVIFAFKKINVSLKKQMNLSLFGSFIFLVLGLKIHPVFLIFVGLSMAPFYPLCVAYISEYAKDSTRTFITFAMCLQSIAVISMHLGVGYLTDQFGLFYAFGVGLFALFFSMICLNFHPLKPTI